MQVLVAIAQAAVVLTRKPAAPKEPTQISTATEYMELLFRMRHILISFRHFSRRLFHNIQPAHSDSRHHSCQFQHSTQHHLSLPMISVWHSTNICILFKDIMQRKFFYAAMGVFFFIDNNCSIYF